MEIESNRNNGTTGTSSSSSNVSSGSLSGSNAMHTSSSSTIAGSNGPSFNNSFYGVSSKWITNEFFMKCEEAVNKEKKKAQASSSHSIAGMGSWFASCLPNLKSSKSSTNANPNGNGNTNTTSGTVSGNGGVPMASIPGATKHGNNAFIGKGEEEKNEVSIKYVIKNVVFPMTTSSKTSIAELLLLSPETRHLVKPKADFYVSCSSDQSLNSLIESIDDTLLHPPSRERFLNNSNQDSDVFVYIDFLCQNQWNISSTSPEKYQAFYSETIPNAIENIGKFVLLIDGSDSYNSQSKSRNGNDKNTNGSTQQSSAVSEARSSQFIKDMRSQSSSAASSSNASVEFASYEARASSTNMTSVLRSRKCLWELYCAASAKHKNNSFVFKLSHRNERHKKKMIENAYTFPEALLKDFGRMIRFEKSVGSNELEDMTLNQILIGYGINPSQLNQAVLLLLARWMTDVCQALLYKLEGTQSGDKTFASNNGYESSIDLSTNVSTIGPESIPQESILPKNASVQKMQKRKMLLCSALATYYEKLNDMENAEVYNRRLVVETEKTYGPLVRHTAVAWHSLAHFLAKRSQKSYIMEAITYYNKALDYCKGYGEVDRIPVLLNDIALCEKLLGAPERSIPLYLEALSYWKSKGDATTDIATCMSNLANSYAASGNLGEALNYHTQSLQVIEKTFGNKHPQCAKRLVRIARIQFMLGAQSIGNELVQKALQIYQDAYGVDSPEFQKVKASIARELQQPNDAMELS